MDRTVRRGLMVVLFVLALGPGGWGCGDDDSGVPDVTEDTFDAPPDESPTDVPVEVGDESTRPDEPIGPDDYPPGPYGVLVGDRIDNLRFVRIDGVSVSLADFYADHSVKLLWIYATAGWCSVCTVESAALGDMYATYNPQGLEILAVVFEDNDGAPATLAYAGSYSRRYGFEFPTVADEPFVLGRYFDKAATPMNMLVDLTDMEILAIEMGWGESSMDSNVRRYLAEIPNRE